MADEKLTLEDILKLIETAEGEELIELARLLCEEDPTIIDKLLLEHPENLAGGLIPKSGRPKVAKPNRKVKGGIFYGTRVIDGVSVKSAAGFTPDPRILAARILASRGGVREVRAPQEWKDLAKKIRDDQKSLGTPKFREAAYPIFIEELKRLYPEDKRVTHISMDVFKRTYLGK